MRFRDTHGGCRLGGGIVFIVFAFPAGQGRLWLVIGEDCVTGWYLYRYRSRR
jgi:hypothetical protein